MKNLQEAVQKFAHENNLNSPIEYRVLDMMSELGEVAKEILKMSNYGTQEMQYRDELKMELGDTLYSLITIANTYDVDLEDALNSVLKKYSQRLEQGGIGSENEK